MLRKTDSEYAPWNLVEAMDRRFATVKIYNIVAEAMEEALEKAGEAARVQAETDSWEKAQKEIRKICRARQSCRIPFCKSRSEQIPDERRI